MAKRPSLSKGEMQVARVLWQLGEASVRQVFEAMKGRSARFATVQTYLRRLEAKGYVRSETRRRTKVYRAAVKPRTVVRETVGDLIERLFGGETLPLMRYVIHDRGISDDEIRMLREMLDRLEENRREDAQD